MPIPRFPTTSLSSNFYQYDNEGAAISSYNNGGLNFTLPGNTGTGTGILPVTIKAGIPISSEFQTIFQVGGDCTLSEIMTAADNNGTSINVNTIIINGSSFFFQRFEELQLRPTIWKGDITGLAISNSSGTDAKTDIILVQK